MRRVFSFYGSTIGKKVVMALTGLILFGFVIGHMIGNLKAFQGPEKFNHYAEGLRDFGAPFLGHMQALWLFRAFLLIAVLLHIIAAVQLYLLAKRARPEDYKRAVHLEDTYASRTMRWGGVLIFVFIVYHILHMTTGSVHPDFVPGDAYNNLVVGFQAFAVYAFYVVTMLVLGVHLYHGVWSTFQSLGANHPKYNPHRRVFATVFAVLIVLGFLTVPTAIQVGAIALE